MPLDMDISRVEGMLDGLDAKMKQTILRKSVRAAADVVVEAMRAAAPEQTGYAGGTALLPGSIKGAIGAVVSKGSDDCPIATIKPRKGTAYVARFLEYGHRYVRGGRNRKGKAQQPGKVIDAKSDGSRPFIRATYETSQGPAMEAFDTTFAEELKEASS